MRAAYHSVFLCICLIAMFSSRGQGTDSYRSEVERLRKRATLQVEFNVDTCNRLADTTVLYFWFVLNRMAGDKTETLVMADDCHGRLDILEKYPMDVKWTSIGPKDEALSLVIPAAIGCPAARVFGVERVPPVPASLPFCIRGFWQRQVQVLEPIWVQGGYRRH